jgi:hypothetical protein
LTDRSLRIVSSSKRDQPEAERCVDLRNGPHRRASTTSGSWRLLASWSHLRVKALLFAFEVDAIATQPHRLAGTRLGIVTTNGAMSGVGGGSRR